MRLPRLLSSKDRRRLAELDALTFALSSPASDRVLMLFCNAYSDACQEYEKRIGATQTIAFTVVKEPMQEALAKLFLYYRDMAQRMARGA